MMPDSERTPQDYDAEDGLDGGMDVCPHCGFEFLPHNPGATCYDASGTRYEHVIDTDAKNRPFYCEDCYKELDANRRAQENQLLEAFNE